MRTVHIADEFRLMRAGGELRALGFRVANTEHAGYSPRLRPLCTAYVLLSFLV